MHERKLHPQAWVVLSLAALFNGAEALCSVFVSVYLWINSHDFNTVCLHFLTLYIVTPFFFILAGWYSQVRDRLHAYRVGLLLHIVFYATLLIMREKSGSHVVALGVLRAVAWGVFYAGNNTINYDVSTRGKVEYFIGLFQAVSGLSALLSPMLSGYIIQSAPTALTGYHIVFAVVVVLYVISFGLSFFMFADTQRRPFHFFHAMFPGKDRRDWALFLFASFTMAGTFNIFDFVLGLLMYMHTGSELQVGSFVSYQTLAGIAVSYVLGGVVVPRNRRRYLFWGMMALVVGGAVIAAKLTIVTLVVFGFLRSLSGSMFGIAQFGLRMDVIGNALRDPAERIEYICAWEVPLALGRIVTMAIMMTMWHFGSESGLRFTFLLLCLARIGTYFLMTNTTALREGEKRG